MIAVRWHRLSRQTLDTIFPPKCVGCRRRGHWLCPACLRRVERLTLPLCAVCGQPADPAGPAHGCGRGPLVTVSAAGIYAGPLRDAVHALKYTGRFGVAATLAGLLAPALAPLAREGDLLVPVPLHPSRQRQRGYNQAAIVASELRYMLPLELNSGVLRRMRVTADQVTLSGEQRLRNVRGAFAVHGDAVKGRRVWLLDDVYTTGATLHEGARALRAAGAREVRGAVVAMTPRH